MLKLVKRSSWANLKKSNISYDLNLSRQQRFIVKKSQSVYFDKKDTRQSYKRFALKKVDKKRVEYLKARLNRILREDKDKETTEEFTSLRDNSSVIKSSFISNKSPYRRAAEDTSIGMTTEPINIEMTEDLEDKSNITKYYDYANENTIEISMNDSSYIGYDTSKSFSRYPKRAYNVNHHNFETGEYMVDGSQKNASSISSILGSNMNKYQANDFRQRMEDVKNKMQIQENSNYDSIKEPMIHESVKEEDELDSEATPTPIAKVKNRMGSVISITETPKSFNNIPFISLKKEQSEKTVLDERPKYRSKLVKQPSITSNNANKIQVITPQSKNRLTAAHTPQQRLRGGTLMNKKKALFSIISRSTTMSKDPKVTTNSITGKKQINQYVILDSIGKGSFAEVKKWFDINTNTKYAMKIIKISKLSKLASPNNITGGVDSLITEIAVMKKLKHKNVIRLKEVIWDQERERLWIVMEYLKQGSVQKMIEKHSLEEETIRKYFRQLIEGLEYWHNVAQIAHRDIKPENLLVDDNGDLKITDFGVSTIIENGNDTITNTAGSNYFFSPEEWKGKKFNATKTDIWACAVTLYSILYRKYPFTGKISFSNMFRNYISRALQ